MKLGLASFIVGLGTLCAEPALAGSCDAIANAIEKGIPILTHVFATGTLGGQVDTLESYTLDHKDYGRRNGGAWQVFHNGDYPTARASFWAGKTCTVQGSETIGGAATDIVAIDAAPDAPVHVRYWIARDSGLVMKTESRGAGGSLTSLYRHGDGPIPPDALAADR